MDSNDADTNLPDAPRIAGLRFRHFRGDEDYPAMLLVNNGSKIADGLDKDLNTLETITHNYNNTPNHDPRRDVLIAEIAGQMVAYTRVFLERELNGDNVYWFAGFVLPEWRGQGLGKALVHWAENRARAIDLTQTDPATAYAQTVAFSAAHTTIALLEEVGYKPVRYEFTMETPNLDHIPDVPLPAGIEIRPATPEQYRAIWDANVEAFRDHWGAIETGGDEFDSFVNNPLVNPELWVVAWDGDQVAGSILNFINAEYNERSGRKLGYTESISVRRPWRRRGLARAMLARSMQVHKDQGMTQTALGVDTANPSGALQLYQSMGYQETAQYIFYRKRL